MPEQIIIFLNGFSAFLLVCFAFILVFWAISSYRKTKSRIYIDIIFFMSAVVIGWMGITLSFLSVMIYGNNLIGLKSIISYFSYSSIPIGIIAILDVVWDIYFTNPKQKRAVLGAIMTLLAFYYVVLFITFQQAVVVSETGVIYDDWLTPQGIPFYLIWIAVLFVSLNTIVGFNKVRKVTIGVLNKRVKYIIIAAPFCGLGILLDTVVFMEPHVNFLFIPRFAMICGAILIYIGFKPTKEELEKTTSFKEEYLDKAKISSIESLFPSRPAKITEEEVTFYREQKICLVCKGKVVKFNFICECDALYCLKCAKALIELENICWACNDPMDEEKPIKPYKKEEEKDFEIQEEGLRKVKKSK